MVKESGLVIKNAVLLFVIAVILTRYPYVLSFNIAHMAPLGGRTVEVRGTVELQRDSEGWTDPENFYWFDLWWQSEAGSDHVFSESLGLIQLHSVTWTIIEEKESSDVLEFTAVITIFPSASTPWNKGWDIPFSSGQSHKE